MRVVEEKLDGGRKTTLRSALRCSNRPFLTMPNLAGSTRMATVHDDGRHRQMLLGQTGVTRRMTTAHSRAINEETRHDERTEAALPVTASE